VIIARAELRGRPHIRRTLINIPARIASSARRIRLHLPEHWPWADAFTDLWTATGHRPPGI
jgi:hypothetical protein